jgi:hypothetical protein
MLNPDPLTPPAECGRWRLVDAINIPMVFVAGIVVLVQRER